MIIGSLPNSTIGFGWLSVSGRSSVPNPPTKIKAFSVILENGFYGIDFFFFSPSFKKANFANGQGSIYFPPHHPLRACISHVLIYGTAWPGLAWPGLAWVRNPKWKTNPHRTACTVHRSP